MNGVFLCWYSSSGSWLLLNNPARPAIDQADTVIDVKSQEVVKSRRGKLYKTSYQFIKEKLAISRPVIFNAGETYYEKLNIKYRFL